MAPASVAVAYLSPVVLLPSIPGRRFVVEVKVAKVEGIEKRIVYNASKAYVMQLPSADTYPALCDVVGVTICDFDLWLDRDAGGNLKVPMLSRLRTQEQHRLDEPRSTLA